MADFFDAPIAAAYPVPSLQYRMFDVVFADYLKQQQADLLAVSAMELRYREVVASLKEGNFPNETKLSLLPGLVFVVVAALPSDRLDSFTPLLNNIGRRLVENGLHSDGKPSRAEGGGEAAVIYSWASWEGNNNGETVHVKITVPETGLQDVYFDKTTRTYACLHYTMKTR